MWDHPQFSDSFKLLVQKILLTYLVSILPLSIRVSLSGWQESSVSGIHRSFFPSSVTYEGLKAFSPLLLHIEAQKILPSCLAFCPCRVSMDLVLPVPTIYPNAQLLQLLL